MRKILYATNNSGKIWEVSQLLDRSDITILSPQDLGIDLDIPETGTTLEENAILKAQAFHQVAPDYLVMADDTGVTIDALNGEPGIHVRRWQDKVNRMSDQAIIDYCLKRLHGIPPDQRTAQFRTVIALSFPDGTIKLFDGILKGYITEKPAQLKIPGLPFEALFYVPDWQLLLGKMRQLPKNQQKKYLTHRERAVQAALPEIKHFLFSV